MHLPPARIIPAALAIGLLMACTEPAPPPAPAPAPRPGPSRMTQPMPIPRIPAADGKPAFQPFLRLAPMAASAEPGGTVQFKAQINYDPEGPQYLRQPVDFLVEEAEGGTVGPNGLYTAPARPGVYHVIARRQGFPDVRARATVTVRAR